MSICRVAAIPTLLSQNQPKLEYCSQSGFGQLEYSYHKEFHIFWQVATGELCSHRQKASSVTIHKSPTCAKFTPPCPYRVVPVWRTQKILLSVSRQINKFFKQLKYGKILPICCVSSCNTAPRTNQEWHLWMSQDISCLTDRFNYIRVYVPTVLQDLFCSS
jgi:hypothetical protein